MSCRKRLTRWLLVGLLILSCGGCSRQPASDPMAPVGDGSGADQLTPVAERTAAPEFAGEELQSGETVNFPQTEAGRIAIYTFFSPG